MSSNPFAVLGPLVPIEWCPCLCDHCTNERHGRCKASPTAGFHAFMLPSSHDPTAIHHDPTVVA